MSGRNSSRGEESDEDSSASSLFSYDFDGEEDCGSHGVAAVYVAVGSGSKIDAEASMDALMWALGNAAEPVRRRSSSSSVVVILVHVFPKIKFVPSPLGMIPISKVNQEQKDNHKTHERNQRMQFLQKFLDVCSASKVKADTLLIESDTEAKAILDLIHICNIRKLVLGTPKANLRKMKWKKGKSTAKEIVKNAPEFCDIKIICEGKEVAMEEQMMTESSSSSERATLDDNQKPVHAGIIQSQNDYFRWMYHLRLRRHYLPINLLQSYHHRMTYSAMGSRQRICLLMCCLAIWVQSNGSEAQLIYNTIVQSGVDKGAVCLDGSPPAYVLDRGSGDGANNWLVYVQGGGWCINNTNYDTPDNTLETCEHRATGDLGSSIAMKPFEFNHSVYGNESSMSYFYNWNRVILKYCDGASFVGDADQPDPVTKLYYRGARIFGVLVRDLMEKGLKDAQNVLLAGGSAGGIGVMAHCDRFRDLFPQNVRVKCHIDSSIFLHVKDPERAKFFEGLFGNIVGLHKPEKALPAECISKMGALSCFYPQNLAKYVKTPLFILNSAQDSFQVRHIFSEELYAQVKDHMVSDKKR
ncbi:unnamed protein product [Cuscuta campestris]|uniref:Pectin acetylesterase n=1 Tax=Cuscuta campestris TaxID=132261 RepID=A0A484NBB0_9ASTE|nr:unnamed protein product [Cuscuta campestris]